MDKKTLYLSDLDGTLLNSSQVTSDYTNYAINKLVNEGMLFSYATARSWNTARKVTNGISASLPAIVYNGAFVIDTVSGKRLISNYFGEEVREVIEELLEKGIYPTVYSVSESGEKFSYVKDKLTKGMADFVLSRKGDSRNNPVESISELYTGKIFYITCIDETENLKPFYDKYKNKYHCVFQNDIYSGEQWLEMMPMNVSKSKAALQLKEYLGCERLVVFGDALNDIDLFECADESYAVANAVDELKKKATDIIESNNADGVAKWLIRRINMSEQKKSITELGNPRKPQGDAGAEMLEGMNERHSAVTGWALSFFEFNENDRILDIGCGGGETLRKMSEKVSDGKLTGIDYSEVSVRSSEKKNSKDIKNGKMNIIEASVEKMPFDNNSFDKVITVESFYFWPDHAKNLKEVYRVLDKGGKFIIVADIHGDAPLDEKDIEGIKKFDLFNPTLNEFKELLENAGFKDISIHTKEGEKWVCAEGNK